MLRVITAASPKTSFSKNLGIFSDSFNFKYIACTVTVGQSHYLWCPEMVNIYCEEGGLPSFQSRHHQLYALPSDK